MPNSKQIVYLSQAQYAELIANGSITVDGVTVTYDENDIYVTPQAEPVTDVRVNGTSITANGVANIPAATSSTPGVIKVGGRATFISSDGTLGVNTPTSGNIKAGTEAQKVIPVYLQHESTFYGLAKVAGHDEASSTETVGTYTPEAKGAIQQMLGVSDLIATAENSLVASKAYAIGDIFIANGKLYKATAAIAADAAIILQNEGEEVTGANAVETKVGEGFVKFTDYATNNTFGIVCPNVNQGIGIDSVTKQLMVSSATETMVKAGTNLYKPIVPARQPSSVFYGLAKAAGDTTQTASNNAVGTYTDDAKAAIRTMLGAVGDVQVNGTSVVSNGVANVPFAGQEQLGVVQVYSGTHGLTINSSTGLLAVAAANETQTKSGTNVWNPLVPNVQHAATFYGLAKASGDTTQAASSNAVGTYTDNAKASIKSMLGIVDGSTGTVDVSGTTPTITAVENTRYVCGEVTSLNFTPAASGICIVRFTSGSSVTVLTLPSTVKFPEWFDPTSLETNTIYEICVTDGVYGAVMSWAQ